MKVLGVSGLDGAISFKRNRWPGLEEREYRIAQGMDASAALIVDGKLVAAAEQERFSGKKHTGDFPVDAIDFCLSQAGISIHEVDEIVHGFDYIPVRDIYLRDEVSAVLYREVFSRDALLAQVRRAFPEFPEEKVFAVGHHLAHAASAGSLSAAVPRSAHCPTYSTAQIEAALEKFDGRVTWKQFDSLADACTATAQLIADGRVLAWLRGGMDLDRALGNRSILADPGHPQMRDRINAMVRKREAFRPFAPACWIEEASRWFDVPVGEEHAYMISVVDLRPEYRAALPAISHVNGSAGLQTVSAQDHPQFHALLTAVGKTTDSQMVLNTSFNVKGQPIVNTPYEAIETFLATGIEYLFLENHHVTRSVD